jgi:hypothetical protein
MCANVAVPGMGSVTGDSQQPGEGDLVGAGAVLGGGCREDRTAWCVGSRHARRGR